MKYLLILNTEVDNTIENAIININDYIDYRLVISRWIENNAAALEKRCNTKCLLTYVQSEIEKFIIKSLITDSYNILYLCDNKIGIKVVYIDTNSMYNRHYHMMYKNLYILYYFHSSTSVPPIICDQYVLPGYIFSTLMDRKNIENFQYHINNKSMQISNINEASYIVDMVNSEGMCNITQNLTEFGTIYKLINYCI